MRKKKFTFVDEKFKPDTSRLGGPKNVFFKKTVKIKRGQVKILKYFNYVHNSEISRDWLQTV